MEAAIIDRTTKGYYWCKIKYKELYNDCMKARAIYCTPDMLAKLQHHYSTQENKSTNHSVATLAQKTKDYFKTNSLLIKVMLCAGAQVVGNHDLWIRIFNKFNLELDTNIARYLKVKKSKKRKRQILQGAKKYKARYSTKRYNKFAEAQKSQLEEMKTGMKYET